MKTVIKVLCLIIIASFVNSCSSNLEENVYDSLRLENLTNKNQSLSENQYMPLGVIPKWAAQKMTDEEYRLWKKISEKFSVDYSFINTPYYQLKKDDYIVRLNKTCVEIKAGLIPEENAKFTVYIPECYRNEETMLANVESIDDNETPDGNSVFTYRIMSEPTIVDYVCIYIRMRGGEFEMLSSEFLCPDGELSAATNARFTPSGAIFITCKGFVKYKGISYSIDCNETFYLR